MQTTLAILSANARVLFANHVTAAAIVEPTPSKTPPSEFDDGIIQMAGIPGGDSPPAVCLGFFGIGTSISDMVANVYGIRRVLARSTAGEQDLYVPCILAKFTAISIGSGSEQPGIIGSPIPNTTNLQFAYAITGNAPGTSGIDWSVCSGAAGQIASVNVATKGFQWIKVVLGRGSGTSINCFGCKC